MKVIQMILIPSHFTKLFLTLTISLIALHLQISAQSLTLDAGFNAGVRDSRVLSYVSVQQPDGKVLVGGSFSFVNGISKIGFTRLNADGTIDTTFNPGGSGTGGGVLDIIVLGDGKILIAGDFVSYNGTAIAKLARLNADGTLDTTFNPGGTGGVGGRLTSISLQADDKIIAAGQGISGYNGTTANGIFRINTDGTLDSSFVSGFATTPNNIEQAIVQADGKIILGGGFSLYGGVTVNPLIRVNTDGTLETNFPLNTGGNQGGVAGIGLQPDGKIIIGGAFNAYDGTARNNIARLNMDGTLDKTFITEPSITINFVEYFAIQADGKVLAALDVETPAGEKRPVIRLNSDGSEDATFTPMGDGLGYHVSLQNDGKILGVGNFVRFTTGEERGGIVRFNSSGSVDSTFSASLRGFGLVDKMLRQPDGKIIAVGQFGKANGVTNNSIVRFNTDGTLDNTFDSGTGIGPGAFGNLTVEALELQPDGKILVGGFIGSYDGVVKKAIARINPDGSLDNSFTFSGDFDLARGPFVRDFHVQPDGKIVVGGRIFRVSNSQNRGLFRLNADGSEDTTYNSGGATTNNLVNGIVSQSDGKIIVVGGFTTYNGISRLRIARINADGTLDTTFDPGTGANSTVNEPALQSNGKVIIGGSFTSYNGTPVGSVARLNADGTLDTTFNVATSAGTTINSLIVQPDGKILLGGDFTSINGTSINDFARLNPDGSLDAEVSSGFGSSGKVDWMVREPGGKVILGGRFDDYGGTPKDNMVRLTESFSGAEQPILFTTNRDGNNEIYKMSEDGTNQQRLTNSPESESGALWSPNGQKILYGKANQIWTMNADGSNQTLISQADGSNGLFQWSPNGQKVSYTRTETGGTDQMWTMNADGSNKTRLTNTTTNDHFASWSPDGNKIAFGRCDATFVCDIFTMNADGTNQVNLTPTNPNDDDLPRWSPDGTKIIFGSSSTGSDYNVYSINPNGTGLMQLTNGVLPIIYFNPSLVSPNGTKVAMLYRAGAITTQEVATVNLDGTNLMNLTNNSALDFFNAWSPDGSKIAFASRQDNPANEIYTMNSDGTGVVRLTNNTSADAVSDWRAAVVPSQTKFDFDGDAKADLSIFRPSVGQWWHLRSSDGGNGAVQFGTSTDKPVPADYTGDGITDVAFWRPSTGEWFILRSEDSSFYSYQFGLSGDIPAPGDFDGDGTDDTAIFRPSTGTWYILRSSGGTDIVSFGISEDKPVVADYDGDGIDDIAIYRPSVSEWWINRSQDGVIVYQFGATGDKTVQGDYTGDGKADVAFFRPSSNEWFVLRSEDSSFYSFPFGSAGDIPAPADYDGDGKFDATVFRPSNTTWFINGSTSGTQIIGFGSNGDVPLASVYSVP